MHAKVSDCAIDHTLSRAHTHAIDHTLSLSFYLSLSHTHTHTPHEEGVRDPYPLHEGHEMVGVH